MRRAGVGSELKALPTLVPVAPWDGKDYAQGSSGGHRKFVHPAPSPSTPIIQRRGEGGGRSTVDNGFSSSENKSCMKHVFLYRIVRPSIMPSPSPSRHALTPPMIVVGKVWGIVILPPLLLQSSSIPVGVSVRA